MATQPDTAAYAHGAHALLHSQLEEAHSRLTGTRAAIAASRLSSVLRGARANRLSRAWQHWSLAAVMEDARRDEETLRREHARLALELRATLASQVALEARASKAEGAADAFRDQLDANEVQARRSVAEATSRGARLAEESVLQALRSSALRDLLRSLDASRLTFALLRWRAGALAATRDDEGAERRREFEAARAGLHALRCKYEYMSHRWGPSTGWLHPRCAAKCGQLECSMLAELDGWSALSQGQQLEVVQAVTAPVQ